MQTAFSATIDAPQDRVYGIVADLGTYPSWLDLVDTAVPADDAAVPADDAAVPAEDAADAWVVTLKARVGPFARSKRLRMVRTAADGETVRFDRAELDGKDHSSWSMTATVRPVDGRAASSEVTMDLDYDGPMWSGLLDGVLAAAAERATDQLGRYVTEPV